MTDGNTEGILVNEPKQATTVSNSNPAVNITHIQKIAPGINRKLTPEELASLKQDRADELASRLAMVPKANEMTQPVHDILDIVGAIPVIGVVADASNGAIYSAEGRVGEAILSYGSAVAGIVQPLGGGAIAKGAKVVKGGTRLIGNGFKRNNNRKTSNNNSTRNNDNKKDGIAVKDEKNKPVNNKECPAVGHPVNPVLGIKFLAGEPECDFTLSSYFPLIWQRRYFSDIAENSWLGQGWTLPFTQHLEKKDDGLHFINEQGSSVKIPPLSPGQCKFDNSSLLYFSREDNNRYRITPAGKKESLIFSPLTIDESDPQGHHATRFPLIGLEDCYGNCIRLIYSSAGLPKSIRTATGQWLTLNFIELNHSDGEMLQRLQRVCLLDENNTVSPLTTYCYSTEGDLCAVRDSSGNTQREFKYTNHILVQQGIPGGVISRYRYNEYTPEGKVMSLYTNLGQTWFFEYNTGSTLVTDPLNRKNCYQFDQNNELTAFTDAKNGTTYYGRDKNGQVNSIIFPDKTETHCTYDRHGNITLITNPAGKKTYIHYDNKSNPISVIDETGKITRYTYDSNSGLKSIIDPLNQTTEYIRDNRGLITEVKDPCGNVYAFLYNSTGLLTGTKDCSGAETRYIRNHTGNIIKTITPDGAVTRLTYTMNGMISTVYHPDGTSDHYHYNLQRQLIGYRNGAGEQTILQLAPDGLLLSKTDPFGRTFSCEYDSARRLTKLKNENNACYTFTYDDNDNLIREQKFDGIVIRYHYNASNKMTKKYEFGIGDEENAGILTVFRRDEKGLITEEIITTDDKDSKIQNYYHYDDSGLLLSAGNNESHNEYVYDAAGRCITEISTVLGQKRTLHYRYDNNGNCINMILPDKSTFDYLYYGSGHLMQINSGSKVLCEIERDIMHREISRTQGNLVSYFSYNKTGKMHSQKVIHTSADWNTSLPMISRRYFYGEQGYLNRVLELSSSTIDYRYDLLGRLTAGGHERFNYDAAGNIVMPGSINSETSIRDNHLKTFDDKIYQYDRYGNLHKKSSGKNESLTLYYSPEHRLLRAEKSSAGTQHDTHYGYDVFGRRIYKKSGGKITTFLWDDDRLLAEKNDDCTITYLYLPQGFIPIALREKKQNRQQELFHYYHTDQIGTPREITDADGKCLWQGCFYAWGKTNKQTGELFQPLRFQGQYYDDETGLHYNRYRYYDPDIGRFITQDPIGLYGGNNAYSYAPNPTGWVDPLGLTKEDTVYRALDQRQKWQALGGRPITPSKPNASMTPQQHVEDAGKQSQYISASKDKSLAQSYDRHGCVISIDLRKIPPRRVTDVSKGQGLTGAAREHAITDREVLIEGKIKPSGYKIL